MLDKRKFRFFALSLVCILIASGLFMICLYVSLSKEHYVNYSEDSDLDYDVIYKDNDFFDDDISKMNSKYIANLIDYIKADFKYDINFFDKNIYYNYKYKIVANVSVLDNEDKEKIYENDDVIYESGTLNGNGRTSIIKTINIDYSKYNELISDFKNTYGLKDAESRLNVNMYININSDKNNDIEKLDKKAVISLLMPLTKKTTGIDISSDLTKSGDRKLLIKSNNNYSRYLLIGVAEVLFALIEIVVIIVHYYKTRTIKNIYDNEIRKLLNTYEGYIQKINSKYKIGTSQVIKVESFNDMLEIRDTLKTPILMLENDAKDGTFFIIPAANGIIYAYALRMVDIIARKEGLKAPDYDLKDIDKKLPKKYTAEFIDKQIEETRSIMKIDAENTIKGTKENDTNLYDQLDKTIIMKPIKVTSIKKATKRKTSDNRELLGQKKTTKKK